MNTLHPSRSQHALWRESERKRVRGDLAGRLRRTADLSAKEEEAAASVEEDEGSSPDTC